MAEEIAFLKSVALLAGFGEARLKELAESSRAVALTPGEVVVHAGDEMHSLGIVLEGKVAAFAGSDQKRLELGRL